MSREHFHVRPRDSGDGWVVDRYDGRGAWVMTDGLKGSWSLAEARRQAAKHTRRAVNDRFNKPPVNRAQCTQVLAGGWRCRHKTVGDSEFCALHRRDT